MTTTIAAVPRIDNGPTDLVIVVPGSDVKRHGEAIERLTDGLQHHLAHRDDQVAAYRISSRQGEGVGQATVDIQRTDGTTQRLDIRELNWTELRPSMKEVAIYTRAWRGGRLVVYWAAALLFTSVPPTSSGLRRWLRVGTIALVVWYLLLLAALYHSAQVSLHEIADYIWPPPNKGPGQRDVNAAAAAILWIAVIAGVGLKWVTDGVDLSWSTYSFMVDREALRRKLRLRLRGMLSHIAISGERYRRVVLLAHSFGTAVVADALAAEPTDGAIIPHLELVTLGSPIEFLACRDAGMLTLVERCLHSDAVSVWSDFYAEEDAFCSKVPLPDRAEGKFHAYRVGLGASPIAAFFGRAHNAYFTHPKILDHVIGLHDNAEASAA